MIRNRRQTASRLVVLLARAAVCAAGVLREVSQVVLRRRCGVTGWGRSRRLRGCRRLRAGLLARWIVRSGSPHCLAVVSKVRLVGQIDPNISWAVRHGPEDIPRCQVPWVGIVSQNGAILGTAYGAARSPVPPGVCRFLPVPHHARAKPSSAACTS